MDGSTGELAFLPLGGTGEIGMNLNLYRCDGQMAGRWIAASGSAAMSCRRRM